MFAVGKIAFFSDTSSRRNNRFPFTHLFHIAAFLLLCFPRRAELESFCALPREDRATELLVLHCPIFTVSIAMA